MAYKYSIDGRDLQAIYGITVSSGSEDFLRFPDRKDSTEHDWSDRNGIDKDTSRVFFKDRPITLNCNLIADNESDFWIKYNAFLSMLAQPGERRLEISEFNANYYVIYIKCDSFTRYTGLASAVDKVACKFTLSLRELHPQADASNQYLISEPGIFIIT